MHKIIVVEDTTLLRMRLTKLLQQSGYDNIIALSSAEPIVDTPQLYLKDVDLIITDIGLPGISGIELTRILNNNPRYCNIPIAVISSYRDVKTINEAMKVGVVDYILKPFDDQVLLEKVERILEKPVIISNKLTDNEVDEIKKIISLEYERATRSKQPLSFIKLKVKSEDIKNSIVQITNKIRKIDSIYALDDNVVTVLPITGEVGAEVVFEKIFNEFVDYNIDVLEREFITYNPDSVMEIEELFNKLA